VLILRPIYIVAIFDIDYILNKMKPEIHPDYKEVVFWDLSADEKFLTRSTVKTSETTDFEGKTYPVYKVEVSSKSHPFYTGKNVLLDTAGRVDKFYKRFGKK
jgi:large subunit ribosomal protein L31